MTSKDDAERVQWVKDVLVHGPLEAQRRLIHRAIDRSINERMKPCLWVDTPPIRRDDFFGAITDININA